MSLLVEEDAYCLMVSPGKCEMPSLPEREESRWREEEREGRGGEGRGGKGGREGGKEGGNELIRKVVVGRKREEE